MPKKTLIVALIAILFLIGLDQFTKTVVADNIEYGSKIELIPAFLYLTYHVNPGAAWGFFEGQIEFFIIITIIALVIFLILGREMEFRTKPFYSVGVVLLIGGTLGNFIDRLRFGHVIDFIDVYIFGYNFPIFNVADMALTIGWACLAFDLIFLNPKRERKDAEENKS